MQYNSSAWKYDPLSVKKTLYKQGQSLFTNKSIRILIPNRYVNRKLCVLASTVQTLAMFAVVVEDKTWAMFCLPNLITLNINDASLVEVDGEEHVQLTYPAHDEVSPNKMVLADSTLAYKIFDCFYQSGYRPWFINYMNYGRLLFLSKKYADIVLSSNNIAVELVVAQLSLCKDDYTKTYRSSIKDGYDVRMDKNLVISPLENILLGATNFATQVNGAYLNQGILTALTQPSERSEPIEQILRM